MLAIKLGGHCAGPSSSVFAAGAGGGKAAQTTGSRPGMGVPLPVKTPIADPGEAPAQAAPERERPAANNLHGNS